MNIVMVAVVLAHAWYPQECCHDKDCHPVPCVELRYHERHESWIWRETVWFPKTMKKSSPDGQCHVCYRRNGEMFQEPYCVFIPDAIT